MTQWQLLEFYAQSEQYNNNNTNNNDILYSAGIRLKEGAHGACAGNIIDKYS